MIDRKPRRSLGGEVVESSLAVAGYELNNPEVSLVETAIPKFRPFRVVLAQNAWNFLPEATFRAMASPYPLKMRIRMRQRRTVARVNVSRSQRVVCMSEAMAKLVEDYGVDSSKIRVAPAYLPLDMRIRATDNGTAEWTDEVLVPGTVTWYKRPQDALALAADRGFRRLRFLGPDDGSGCWQEVREIARSRGLLVSREVHSRAAMHEALTTASLVVLPSGLESLGFSLGEAIAHARKVVASPLPAHVEAANWFGVEPEWLGQKCNSDVKATNRRDGDVRAAWEQVAHELGLSR